MTGGFGALTVYLILPDGTSIWLALPLMLIGGAIVSVLIAVGAERFAYRPLRSAPTARPAHHRHRPLPRPPAGRLHLVPRRQERQHLPAARRRPLPHRLRQHPDAATSSSSSPPPSAWPPSAVFVRTTRTGRAMQATAQDPDTATAHGHRHRPHHRHRLRHRRLLRRRRRRRLRPQVRPDQVRHGLPGSASRPSPPPSSAASATSTAPCSAASSSASPKPCATAYIADIPGMQQLGGGAWADVWAFVLLILVLLVRPQGLLGERVADRA